MIDPIGQQACYELLKWMEEAWKMGGYWKMSEGERARERRRRRQQFVN